MCGFGIGANGSNMRCKRKPGIEDNFRFWTEQQGGVTAEMRNNGRRTGLENNSGSWFWTCYLGDVY